MLRDQLKQMPFTYRHVLDGHFDATEIWQRFPIQFTAIIIHMYAERAGIRLRKDRIQCAF